MWLRYGVVLLLISLVSMPVFAGNREEAAASIKKGNDALKKGKYTDAITRFEIASKLDPSLSSPYAGLGFAYKGLGKCEEALVAFSEYLTRNPTGNAATEVTAAKAECRAQLYVTVVVSSSPSGARVKIGEEIEGVTPFTYEDLRPGDYLLSVSLDGHELWTMNLRAELGRSYVIPEVTLKKLGSDNASVIEANAASESSLRSIQIGSNVGVVSLFGGGLGFLGTGVEISALQKIRTNLSLGVRLSFENSLVVFEDILTGERITPRVLGVGVSAHWKPLAKKPEFLSLGVEVGGQLARGESVVVGGYARVLPSLWFWVGDHSRVYLRPVGVGLVENFSVLSLEILSLGYGRGF